MAHALFQHLDAFGHRQIDSLALKGVLHRVHGVRAGAERQQFRNRHTTRRFQTGLICLRDFCRELFPPILTREKLTPILRRGTGRIIGAMIAHGDVQHLLPVF